MSQPPVYLDHAATTPLDPRVLDAMLPYLRGEFGNAASRQHARGQDAAAAVEEARGELALALGADPREVVFTSGATEANNLALRGVAAADAHKGRPRRILTAVNEHHAVLDPLDALEKKGFEVLRIGVDGAGHIDLERLEAKLREGLLMVSLMAANNETGVCHPLASIGALCREHGALFHTDATQLVGKRELNVDAAHVDLLSLSAHKFYGPMGVGALYLRRKRPRVRVEPLMLGGGHEGGRRSGTLNLPGIVGLGRAIALRRAESESQREPMGLLRDRFEEQLVETLGGISINGDPTMRLEGHSNLAFDGVDAEALLGRLTEVQASSSAACTSATRQPSHVLRALGLDPARVRGSVRFSLGKDTDAACIDRAAQAIAQAVRAERAEGPRDACAL